MAKSKKAEGPATIDVAARIPADAWADFRALMDKRFPPGLLTISKQIALALREYVELKPDDEAEQRKR